jgi:predicted hydrolase (HD superfamily)
VTWCESFPEILKRVRIHASKLVRNEDTLLVSPYRKIMKNFADRADAPDTTRVDVWHVKPFGISLLLHFELDL